MFSKFKGSNARKIYLLFLVVFLFSFVSAADSTITTTFNVGGCTFTFDGIDYGVATGFCSQGGETDGYFFCEDLGGGSTREWYTLEDVGVGCSRGIAYGSYDPVIHDGCCPSWAECVEVSGQNGYVCERRDTLCSEYVDSSNCLARDCIWLSESSQCMANTDDLSCDYYTDLGQAACEEDNHSLYLNGIGGEIVGSQIECNGSIFTISSENTRCSWNGSACHLNYSVEQTYEGGGGPSASFSCTSVYTLGDCEDGQQSVNWGASQSQGYGSFSGDDVPLDCLEAVGCSSGEATRFCGEPSIKLPGFGIYSLLISISLIFVFYVIKRG